MRKSSAYGQPSRAPLCSSPASAGGDVDRAFDRGPGRALSVAEPYELVDPGAYERRQDCELDEQRLIGATHEAAEGTGGKRQPLADLPLAELALAGEEAKALAIEGLASRRRAARGGTPDEPLERASKQARDLHGPGQVEPAEAVFLDSRERVGIESSGLRARGELTERRTWSMCHLERGEEAVRPGDCDLDLAERALAERLPEPLPPAGVVAIERLDARNPVLRQSRGRELDTARPQRSPLLAPPPVVVARARNAPELECAAADRRSDLLERVGADSPA